MRLTDVRRIVVVFQVNRGGIRQEKDILGSENSMCNGPEESGNMAVQFNLSVWFDWRAG